MAVCFACAVLLAATGASHVGTLVAHVHHAVYARCFVEVLRRCTPPDYVNKTWRLLRHVCLVLSRLRERQHECLACVFAAQMRIMHWARRTLWMYWCVAQRTSAFTKRDPCTACCDMCACLVTSRHFALIPQRILARRSNTHKHTCSTRAHTAPHTATPHPHPTPRAAARRAAAALPRHPAPTTWRALPPCRPSRTRRASARR